MTPDQTEVLAKLKEIEEQLSLLLQESADVPGLARSRILHARNLVKHLLGVVGSNKLALIRGSGDA